MKKYYIAAAVLGVGLLGLAIWRNYPHKTAVTPASQQTYVALGDSVAAGVGLQGASDSSACDRTNQSYPNLVASSLHDTLANFACSGATLPAGILGSQNVNQLLVAPQLQQLFGHSKPNLITLTVGANDAHWTSIIAKCYTAVCGTAQDTAAVNASLNTVASNLRAALSQIQQHYRGIVPRVMLTGYHQVFPTALPASCTDLAGIDASELTWVRQLETNLNDTIRAAASGYSFATFAPINFSGHELCTANPWVQGLADKQPYHPNAAGQAAYAAQILSALKAAK